MHLNALEKIFGSPPQLPVEKKTQDPTRQTKKQKAVIAALNPDGSGIGIPGQ